MIIGNKDQRTVAKRSGSKGIVHCNNSTIIDTFPVFNGADGSLICETIPYTLLACEWVSSNVPTFQSPEAIIPAVLARGRFVNPTWVTEYSSTFVVAGVQCNKRMIILNRWKLGIYAIS